MKYLMLFLVLFFLNSGVFSLTRTKVLLLMGSRFEITAISDSDSLIAESFEAAIAEIQRLENLLSTYISTSEVSLINKMAGIEAVKVDKEVFDLIFRCKKVSVLTNGLFDISWASMDKIWHFDGTMQNLPDENLVKQSVSLVNYEDIILDKNSCTVFLKKKGMKIDFGAIGKGLAANHARDIMRKTGIQSGIVIAGGDLITWGRPENKETWTIGIANPENTEKAFSFIEVGETSVVTSGNYEKFTTIDGIRYTHIINPKTGYPASGLRSVTIICPNAELADALATSVFLMGNNKGMEMVNKMQGVECIIVDDNFNVSTSANIKLNYYKNKEEIINNHFTIK